MAAMLNGARPLAWFAGVLGVSVPQLLAQAQASTGENIPIFLPYLSGERSPHGDPNIRGEFYGLSDHTNQPDLCRAVVEAIGFMMRDSVDSFGDDLPEGTTIPVLGVGSKSDLVMQTLANVLGIWVARTSAGVGGSALGAALLAEVGIGRKTLNDLSFNVQTDAHFKPRPTAALQDRLDKYRRLYTALKDAV